MLNTQNMQLAVFLDLFVVGYKNAYFSDMSFLSKNKVSWRRMEMVLPNVGSIRLYQSFYDNENDEQIPFFKVFYTNAIHPNINARITDEHLLCKAVHMMYNSQKSFNDIQDSKISHTDDTIIKTVLKNAKIARNSYMKTLEHQKSIMAFRAY